jgi:hypothetical protein
MDTVSPTLSKINGRKSRLGVPLKDYQTKQPKISGLLTVRHKRIGLSVNTQNPVSLSGWVWEQRDFMPQKKTRSTDCGEPLGHLPMYNFAALCMNDLYAVQISTGDLVD